MSRHTKLSAEEIELILRACDDGFSLRQITHSVDRSCYAIQCCLRNHGKEVIGARQIGVGNKKLPEVMDYSRLNDSVLFNPKLYPSF